MMISVPVFEDAPDVADLCAALHEYGILVLDTSRTEAAKLAGEVKVALALDLGHKDSDVLVHLAAQMEFDEGLSLIDYLVYSAVFESSAVKAQSLVQAAMRQWQAAGRPDGFVAKVNESV